MAVGGLSPLVYEGTRADFCFSALQELPLVKTKAGLQHAIEGKSQIEISLRMIKEAIMFGNGGQNYGSLTVEDHLCWDFYL
jgi:hypothetical protein